MIRLQEEKSLVILRQCVNDINQIHFVLEPLYEFGLRCGRVMLFLRHFSFSIKNLFCFWRLDATFNFHLSFYDSSNYIGPKSFTCDASTKLISLDG